MDKPGFTLVELLVVLALVSVFLVMVVPSYGFLMNSSRLAAVTNDLMSTLQLARSEAIKRGIRVTVCKSGDAMAAAPICSTAANWAQGWLAFVDGGTRGVVDPGDTLLWVHGQIASGTITPSSNYSRFVSYLPSGASEGSGNLANGSIRVCFAGERRDIIINNTGRPRLASAVC
jgi:type IV fimbrial biogenesis protein FimT